MPRGIFNDQSNIGLLCIGAVVLAALTSILQFMALKQSRVHEDFAQMECVHMRSGFRGIGGGYAMGSFCRPKPSSPPPAPAQEACIPISQIRSQPTPVLVTPTTPTAVPIVPTVSPDISPEQQRLLVQQSLLGQQSFMGPITDLTLGEFTPTVTPSTAPTIVPVPSDPSGQQSLLFEQQSFMAPITDQTTGQLAEPTMSPTILPTASNSPPISTVSPSNSPTTAFGGSRNLDPPNMGPFQ